MNSCRAERRTPMMVLARKRSINCIRRITRRGSPEEALLPVHLLSRRLVLDESCLPESKGKRILCETGNSGRS